MYIFKRFIPPDISDRSFLSVCLGLIFHDSITFSLQLLVAGVILLLTIKPSL